MDKISTKIQATLQALVEQRNNAMNQVAELMGELASVKEELAKAQEPKEEASA